MTLASLARLPRRVFAYRLPRANRGVMVTAIVWLAIVLLAAALADVLPVRDPISDLDYAAAMSGPSLEHPLGTDDIGRDILSRLVHGARVSLVIGFGVVAAGIVVGGVLGIVASYRGGFTDVVVVVILDAVLAFPGFILAMAIAAFLGQSILNVAIAISIPLIPGFARIARAQTLVASKREFVLTARAIGATGPRIVLREIAPTIAAPVLAYGFVAIGLAIVIEGGLSFLSLGVPSPQPSWGGMIADGLPRLSTAPFISLIPATVMLLTVLSLNLLADGLSRGASTGRR